MCLAAAAGAPGDTGLTGVKGAGVVGVTGALQKKIINKKIQTKAKTLHRGKAL